MYHALSLRPTYWSNFVLVELLEGLGEALLKLVPGVCSLEVGRGAHQGLEVGHKGLGDVRGLGKLRA